MILCLFEETVIDFLGLYRNINIDFWGMVEFVSIFHRNIFSRYQSCLDIGVGVRLFKLFRNVDSRHLRGGDNQVCQMWLETAKLTVLKHFGGINSSSQFFDYFRTVGAFFRGCPSVDILEFIRGHNNDF